MKKYDRVILGSGLYGLYFALRSYQSGGGAVLVIDPDIGAFRRATYINQARVHMGYHYPRSLSTAKKSASYFNRFVEEFSSSVKKDFLQIYATSKNFSWTNSEQFVKFCLDTDIPCEQINHKKYFKDDTVDGAFITKEYTYDAQILKEDLLEKISKCSGITLKYGDRVEQQQIDGDEYVLVLQSGEVIKTPFILNATYASVNQVHKLFGFEPINIKYELCEIILCEVSQRLKDIGITVMDGPFFSIMPFGKTGFHSLTSVTFTPHKSSHLDYPKFSCQTRKADCALNLYNCNDCEQRPDSAWQYMSRLARKYLRRDYTFEYNSSLYSMKPILKASEIDDSRPTVIRKYSTKPEFYSVLSGKINTMYDLEEIL